MTGCGRRQRRQSLGCESMSAGRGRQSVANLNDSVVGRPLEADPADGLPVRALRDPVVAERALLAVTLAGGDESAQGHDVAVERVVIGPLVLSCRGLVADAPCFRRVDRVQDQASCLYVGHGRIQRATPETSNRFDYRAQRAPQRLGLRRGNQWDRHRGRSVCGLGLAELADGFVRIFGHLPRSGLTGGLLCACARAFAAGDVNWHVLRPSAATDSDMPVLDARTSESGWW